MRHRTDEELENHFYHRLPRLAALFCTLHLKSCAACRSRFRMLAEDDRFLDRFARELDEYRKFVEQFEDPNNSPDHER